MKEQIRISVSEFCHHNNISVTFLQSLDDYGLIHMQKSEEQFYLDPDDLTDLEKMVRLHYELDINMEGIDAIIQLLKRMENIQEEVVQLKNRLKILESSR